MGELSAERRYFNSDLVIELDMNRQMTEQRCLLVSFLGGAFLYVGNIVLRMLSWMKNTEGSMNIAEHLNDLVGRVISCDRSGYIYHYVMRKSNVLSVIKL